MNSKKNEGFGLIEVLMAMAIMLAIGIALPSLFATHRKQLTSLTSTMDCQTTADAILTNIKSIDNSLKVRVFLPTSSRPTASSYLAGAEEDPFCRSGEGRRPVCDRVNILGVDGGAYVATGAPLYNSQNIRGAATWAQSLFNQYVPAICTGEGLSLLRDELQQILPNAVVLPSWITGIRLSVREEGASAAPCTAGSVSRIGANSSNQYEVAVSLRGEGMACSSRVRVSFPQDQDATDVTLTLSNGAGQAIPNLAVGVPACSCRSSMAEIAANGGVCPGMSEVRHAITSSEPGTVLLCRREAPAGQADPPDRWRSCGDVNFLGATATFTPDLRSSVAFNQPLSTTWTLGDLPNSASGEHYQIKVRDVDVGGNFTEVLARYRVAMPTCPNPNTYCPGATPAGTGIFFLPNDDCNIGPCPPGTRSVCDEAIRPTICVGSTYPDDCGANVCAGSKPVRCGNPADYACGSAVPDLNGCGGSCGTGTRGCGTTGGTSGGTTGGSCIADNAICGEYAGECGMGGSYDNCLECCAGNGWYQHDTGYEPYNTNCPGFCDMSGPKYRRYHCTPRGGAPGPSGGTPESCGGSSGGTSSSGGTTGGTTGEPPPPPWDWTGGMFQCTDRNGSRSCSYNFPSGAIPSGRFSRFEVRFRVAVIAHDGDPSEMLTQVEVSLSSGGSSDRFSDSTQPRTPRERETDLWSGTLSVSNSGTPSISIRSRVDEATTKTYFSIHAIP